MIRIIKKGAAVATPPEPVKSRVLIPRKPLILPPAAPTPPPSKEATTLDGECKAAIALAPNAVVPWFLMASYLYYVHHRSLLSDALYDQMAREMLANWEDVDHRHKHMITTGDLEAGTLYRHKGGDYPLMVRGAACRLAFLAWDVRLDDRKGDDFDGIE